MKKSESSPKNKGLSRIHSSSSTDPVKPKKRTLWQKLTEPSATITLASERRQATLVSMLLLILALSMISGVVYMGFFSSNPAAGFVLAGADIVVGIAYFLSRTRHSKLAALISLIALAIIPVLNVALGTDHTSEALLILLIWNILTILLSSAIASIQITGVLVFANILTLALFPVFIPSVSFNNIALPLIFNGVTSIVILVFAQHRNLMEKERQSELSQANAQLQIELTERTRAEKQLVYTALHDPLTDLPNRVLFMDRLHHAMEHAKRHKNFTFVVFFVDLDRFKVVNDSLGHNVGDLLLVESAHRLSACVRSEDTVARLGGDEFVILLEDVESSTDHIRVADRIQSDLAAPFDLEGNRVFISVSMGIVLSAPRYERSEDILRDADIAMYRAKGLGRGRYELFYTEMLARVMTRLELETDLRKALERQEFIVHYQPIMELGARKIVGFEALVRWQHPTRGLIQPEDFIPMAEESGLIVPMGYWVLTEACRQIREWQVQYPAAPPLTMNVNLSAVQCTQPDLVQKITELLVKNELIASSLKLELTESVIVEDSESTANTLTKLRDLGIQVQIDDFGTGYSALGYLHTLPIDTLKIDRTFISRLGSDGSGSEIVRTILELAHDLGMKVVAEGVETDEQLTLLKEMECEFGQGFLFNKPLDSLEVGTLLKALPKIDD